MFRTILRSLREYKKTTFLTPLFIIIEVACECAIPFLTNLLINEIKDNGAGIKNGDVKIFVILCVSLVALAMLSLLAGFLAAKFAAKAACGLAKNLRHDMFYKIQDFSFENIDKFSASSLVTRMTTDVSNIQMAYGMIIRGLVRSPLMVIFSVIMVFVVNVKIGVVFVIMVPVVALLFLIIIKLAMPLFTKIFTKYDKLNESVLENINGIRVVKNYVREDYEKEKFNEASGELRKGFTKAERIVAFQNPIMQLAIQSSVFISSIFGAYIIASTSGKDMDVGGLQSIIQYGVQILMALMFLTIIFVMLSLSLASGKRIAEVLNEESTIKNPENPIMDVKNGDIEFKNVSFKYKKDAKRNALDNINLKIKSGQTVGIIGTTGSSKTSLVNLISRLYDVTSGEILVGDNDVKNYDLKLLRDNVSVVLQKNVLFSGTIAENLRWGNKNATQEDLDRVSKIACCDEFINRFPQGYDTYIEQGGTNVSGGQKQRLCIARALLKSPKILILDDSTSAVDTRTDAKLREGLRNYLPDTTKIIIAQRITSVYESDLIIVLDDGEINGMGTHEELLKSNEIYKEIFEIQNRISSKGCDL
jgi:ATP-binding cassette subfamily B protein